MAINGDGFFSVQSATGTVDNAPVFSGVTDYTRRGDFQVNANGNLVNGAGYYLMGVAVDPKTGNPHGNVPQVLHFQNNFVPAQATSAIQYAANLPTTPATTASATAIKGTLTAAGGLTPADFSQNPLVLGTPATPYGDNTSPAPRVSNQSATPVPITAATALSGTAQQLADGELRRGRYHHGRRHRSRSYSLPAARRAPRPISSTSTTTVGNLLEQDRYHHRVAAGTDSINATTGAITLHTGTAANLSVLRDRRQRRRQRSARSASHTTVTASRTGGGTAGTGVVTANDLTTFNSEIDQRRRGHGLQLGWNAG